ncbi:MAG TPA: hypothetical protein VI356_24415 [Myxococcales bacterium]
MKLLEQLPREEENPQNVRTRLRITTSEGKTIVAFARAGEGKLGFTGWEMRKGMTGEEDWQYFVLGAEHVGDPLQVISEKGPLGVVTGAELEERQ